MTTDAIPPKRSENIVDDKGIGTRRFMNYIEAIASFVNGGADSSNTSVIQDLSISASNISRINKRLNDFEILQ